MIINKKEFTQIKTHPLYFISRDAEVFSSIKNRILKPGKNSVGYLQVWIIDENGNPRWERVHVLNALTHVPNPDCLPEVNHDDGNKMNNNDWNLKWCTRQQNQLHAFAKGLLKSRKGVKTGLNHSDDTKKVMSVKKIGKNHPKYIGDYITPKGRFHSRNEAAKINGVSSREINKRCNDKTWLYLGWEFKPKK